MSRQQNIRAQRQRAWLEQDRAKREKLEPTVDFVLARRTDPMSSHRAAQAIVKSGARKRQADAVLEALRSFDGSTTRELAELAGLDRYMVGRRMPELAREGRVKRVEFFDGRDCRWYVVQPVVEIRHPALASTD